MRVDEDTGELYVAGRTVSTDFPTTPGAFITTYSGGSFDAFVTKINAAGSALHYSTFLDGDDADGAHSIAVDPGQGVVLAGYTNSSDFPTTPDALDPTHNGSHDVFVTRINRHGTSLVYSTVLGGGSGDVGRQIRYAGSGNYWVFGYTGSGTFPVTPGAYDTTINGMAHIFVTLMTVPAEIADKLGVFLNGNWYLDYNGNGT